MIRRLVWPVVGTVLVVVGVDLLLARFDFEPNHLRLALLLLLVAVVAALLRVSLVDREPDWQARDLRPMTVSGSDRRLAAYVRLIESHRTAATPDPALRDQLATLGDERLRRRGLDRGDPAAAELLGADLMRDLTGPARRLSLAEIARYVERIEGL